MYRISVSDTIGQSLDNLNKNDLLWLNSTQKSRLAPELSIKVDAKGRLMYSDYTSRLLHLKSITLEELRSLRMGLTQPTSKFKVGDRVIRNSGIRKGRIGTVIQQTELANPSQARPYLVRWDSGYIFSYPESYLELAGQESLQAVDVDAGQQAVTDTCTCASLLDEPDSGCPFHSARQQLSERDLLKEKLSRTFGILRQEPRTRADVNYAHMAKGDRR